MNTRRSETIPLAGRLRRLRALCVGVDFVSTSVAWLLFDIVRFMLLGSGYSSLRSFLLAPKVMAGQLLFPAAMLAVYWVSGYYSNPMRRSRGDDIGMTVAAALAATVAVLISMLLNDLTPVLADDYLVLGTLLGSLTVIVALPRLMITAAVRRRVADGRLVARAAVVTTDGCDSSGAVTGIPGLVVTHRGSAPDMAALAAEGAVDCFVLAPATAGRLETLMPSLARVIATDLPVYIMAGREDMVARRYGQGIMPGRRRNRGIPFACVPVIDISRTDMSAMTLNLKRLSDIVVATAATIATAPLVGALALAVKLTSPGPAFYRQKRLGYHRKPFEIIKLRTMRHGAEDTTGPALTSSDDSRVTPLGRIMRRYHLDELPQFVNVVRGDMSLVGPRPERPHYVALVEAQAPFYTLVHQLRPGITSWGMVEYGYASTVDDMVRRLHYDLLYLENAGFLVDMKIIIHTLKAITQGKGL